MQIFGRTQPLAQYPILTCLEVIQRLGFDGVEICLENPDLDPASLTEELARRVGDHARSLGLACSVSYHKDYVYDDEMLKQTIRAIELVPAFGCDVFIISNPVRRTGDADEWRRTVDRTRELVRVAEQVGVTLAEEFEPGFVIGSTADLHRLFDEIPSPHLQANVDLGHVFLCDPQPLEAIRSLQGRIVHGHVENMASGVHRHLLPWEGDMDLAAYMRVLDEIGFDGPLALDLYEQDYEAVGQRAVAYLRELIP